MDIEEIKSKIKENFNFLEDERQIIYNNYSQLEKFLLEEAYDLYINRNQTKIIEILAKFYLGASIEFTKILVERNNYEYILINKYLLDIIKGCCLDFGLNENLAKFIVNNLKILKYNRQYWTYICLYNDTSLILNYLNEIIDESDIFFFTNSKIIEYVV